MNILLEGKNDLHVSESEPEDPVDVLLEGKNDLPVSKPEPEDPVNALHK